MSGCVAGMNREVKMVQGLRIAGSILSFLGLLGRLLGAVLTIVEVLA
jgi:hypothetical protein